MADSNQPGPGGSGGATAPESPAAQEPAATPTHQALVVRRAKVADAEAISALIAPYAEADLMLPRSVPAVYEMVRDFHVALAGERVIACAALHVFNDDLAEVKSLAVASDQQGKGLAGRLIRQCLDDAAQLGLKRVFALVLHDDLWLKLGFERVAKETLPQKVWGECIYCPKFHRCDEVAVAIAVATPSRSGG